MGGRALSTRQRGNVTENRFADLLRAHGYCVYPTRGSRGIDLLAVHSETKHCIAVEVGGASKRLRESFGKLREATVPVGTLLVVARYVKRGKERHYRWSVNLDEDARYDTLDAALDAARDR